VNANLSLWHRERALWRKESSCDASCACSTQPWFRSISSSEAELSKGLLCAAVECSELAVDDGSVVPKLYAPTCTRGECDHVDCLKKKLEQLRACKTEFADSDTLVRYRKYAKMERTRNDGSKYTEVEFVSSIESYPEHRRAHNWAVRQRKLVIERLKQAGTLAQLASKLDMTEAETMQALLSFEHTHHLKITDHDIITFTDFAARVKYVNFSSSTCEHPNQGTLCIACVLNSPTLRPVQKDTTVTEQLPTGLESATVSDERKAPQTVKLGKQAREVVLERTLLCDVFCGYSNESGNARFNHTLLRDIIAYYKLGHLVHATAATHRGVPLPIGKVEGSKA